jgi:hypothetical protein
VIRQAPELRDVRVGSDVVAFCVVVTVDAADLPGVSVKSLPKDQGAVFVVACEEVARSADGRVMRFDVEAERGAVAYDVAVTASCGAVTVALQGPRVAARG